MPHSEPLSARRLRSMFVAAVVGLTVLVPLIAPAESAPTKASTSHAGHRRAARARVSFTPPVPLAGGGAEPSIRNDATGAFAAYVSAPTGLGSNFWRIKEIRNADGSISFDPSLPLQPDLGTGGGDSEISLGRRPDPKTGCQNIAYSGLHNIDLLDNFTTAMSANCGKTFTDPNFFATQNTLTDRQWQTFDGSFTNFLIYHKVDTSQIVVSQSLDGGATYTSLSPDGSRGIIDPPTMPNVVNDNQIGNIVTDYSQPVKGMKYANGEQVHALYAIFAGPRDPADNAEGQRGSQDPTVYNHIDTIYVGKSVDGGQTWTDTRVYTTKPSQERELNLLFPVIAVDRAGTVYTVWSDQFKVQYAFSRNHGRTWSKPFQVNPDNRRKKPDKARADIFPWIAAGGRGKVDVVWYHGRGGAPDSNLAHRDPGDPKTKWTVGFAQLFRANRWNPKHKPAPRIVTRSQNVSGLIHKGDICNNGIGCDAFGGDRTLLDFFEVSVDHAGRANVAYASDATSPGSATVEYIRQNGGRSALTGRRIATQRVVPLHVNNGTSCPGPQVVDAYGDAHSNILVAPNEQGGNLDTYDIGAVRFATPDATHLKVTLTIKDLSAVPVPGTTSTLYAVFWQFGGKTYYVSATTNGPGAQFYDEGEYTDNFNSTGDPQGQFNEGKDGTIVWTVDRPAVGNPPNGQQLVHPHAETHGAFTAAGSGLRYVAFVDRAPNVRTGAPYTLGGSC